VNGSTVAMEPLAPVPPLGTFPPVGALAPVGKACGTLIRISDRVLFDFDQATLRPEAGPVLDEIAGALAAASGGLRIDGHTDSMGADAYNLDLSQRRAAAVVDGLRQRRVQASMEPTGFGEGRPIAANELAGRDNPAGRQLNRRVEIVIPPG
jgi:OOP family OmpA-OmpF porin